VVRSTRAAVAETLVSGHVTRDSAHAMGVGS
jgi:hypothetical protein